MSLGISGFPPRSLGGDAEGLKAVFDRVMADSFLKIKGRDPIVAGDLWIQTSPGTVNLRSAPWRSGGESYLLFPRDKKDGYVITKTKSGICDQDRLAGSQAKVQAETHGLQP